MVKEPGVVPVPEGKRKQELPSQPNFAVQPMAPIQASIPLIMVGDHPLATEDINGISVPKNASACLFLAQKGFTERNYLLTSHPDHSAGCRKIAYLLAYENGKGISIPPLGINAGTRPDDTQLQRMVDITLSWGRGLNKSEMKALELIRDLEGSAEPFLLQALENYVPMIIRGVGDEVELCLRKDNKVSTEKLATAIRVVEDSVGISPLKVKIVSTRDEDIDSLTEKFEGQGQLWRLYPPTKSRELQADFIENSRITTPHGLTLYYAPGSGGRILTVTELNSMVGKYFSGTVEREVLADQFSDLVTLAKTRNRVKQPSLSLLKVDEEKFRFDRFEHAVHVLTDKKDGVYVYSEDDVKGMLAEIIDGFTNATDAGFRVDNLEDANWRLTMYNRMMGIRKAGTEEMRIGLSREFIGDVNWLPGGKVVQDNSGWRIDFEGYTNPVVRDVLMDLDKHCRRTGLELEHVNMGEVVESASKREKLNIEEERKVYIVEWKARGDERNRVYIMRKQKWDEAHYLLGREFDVLGSDKKMFVGVHTLERMQRDERGHLYLMKGDEREYLTNFEGKHLVGEGRKLSRDEARTLAAEYRQFVVDRNELKKALGLDIPRLDFIRSQDDIRGVGKVDIVFFNRSYVGGTAVDKIDDQRLRNPEFCSRLAYLMGREAAINFAIGRANPFTGKVLYGDGDEIVQFDREMDNPSSMPQRLVVADGTSTLGDVDSPPRKFTPTYAKWLGSLLQKASEQGVPTSELNGISLQFLRGLSGEHDRIRGIIGEQREQITHLFLGRAENLGHIRFGWVGADYLVPRALNRVSNTRSRDLVNEILADESLREFSAFMPDMEKVLSKT